MNGQNIFAGGATTPQTLGEGGDVHGGAKSPDILEIWQETLASKKEIEHTKEKVDFAVERLDKQENIMFAAVIVLLVMVGALVVSTLVFYIQQSKESKPNVIIVHDR